MHAVHKVHTISAAYFSRAIDCTIYKPVLETSVLSRDRQGRRPSRAVLLVFFRLAYLLGMG